MKPLGQIEYFRSRIDGSLSPCAVCATDTSDEPKPLILEVSPGALRDLSQCVAQVELMADAALKHGKSCVVLRPTGRGNGSVYQHYGEVDALEAIEHVKRNYPIDGNRVSITGSSMGGAATWYLISHYPDVFSAAAPFCGYCDYRLWEKPGGSTFHMHEWEEPSWIARSAAFLIENLRYTPVWMVHGEWDRAVGGGVSVEHSRQMARLFEENAYRFHYTEVPETGHGCRLPEIFEKVILWLLEQEKQTSPDHVVHSAFALRHNGSHWITIEQFEKYGVKASVDAHKDGTAIQVSTENVRAFSLSLHDRADRLAITIDGNTLLDVDLTGGHVFRKDPRGVWQNGPVDLLAGKRHGVSGPIGDLFFDGTILVPGTSGTGHEMHTGWILAQEAARFYSSRNGGVHRGGIMGDNDVGLRVIKDDELTESDLRQYNLILYGTHSSNSVLARFKDSLPISFEGQTIRVGDKEYTADGCAVFAVFPHPENSDRYVAVHGGTTPDATCWGSHLDMHLLPDFIVYAKGELIDWGFWNNQWTSQA
jgi:pimeloyl-ACP methyl ester carboxylesterase